MTCSPSILLFLLFQEGKGFIDVSCSVVSSWILNIVATNVVGTIRSYAAMLFRTVQSVYSAILEWHCQY